MVVEAVLVDEVSAGFCGRREGKGGEGEYGVEGLGLVRGWGGGKGGLEIKMRPSLTITTVDCVLEGG